MIQHIKDESSVKPCSPLSVIDGVSFSVSVTMREAVVLQLESELSESKINAILSGFWLWSSDPL